VCPVIKRLGGIAGGILDRQARHAGLHPARNIDRNFLRLMGKAAFEIGVDRQIDRRAQRGEMRADIVDGDPIVGLSNRPCKARTGGRKRLESQMLQRQRAADVPWVGNREATGLMHLPECCAFVLSCDRHDRSLFFVLMTWRDNITEQTRR